MRRRVNQGTQPHLDMPVFNNWDVVAEGWYLVMPGHELKVGGVRSLRICGQQVVFYRGDDRVVRALDAFCPHMGADLGIGKVVGDQLQCFFHNWQFDGAGHCTHIPVSESIPKQARLQAYATDERFGYIWVYPAADAPEGGVPCHRELEGLEVVTSAGTPFYRTCHQHVTMINGIDPQHLRTVHNVGIEMDIDITEDEDRGLAQYTLRGELPATNLRERFICWLVGKPYCYRMLYSNGTVGFLTVMKDTFLFGGERALPELYMIYAYRPEEEGRLLIQPLFVTKKRPGIFGALVSQFCLLWMRLIFHVLVIEDGKIYEGIRFRPASLLPIDGPVSRFIRWVNQRRPSRWSSAGYEV